ncbi:hypothetical protein BCR34DRAFT_618216 [Clohesyomyces aquaticus]|uniref:Uncharacterized protein n=1 Tax=Clohesyomyces aquaticus TaxID=1231657 RepID=A0A1Y1YUU7_9PLEO|nr:hypothetical protein BCR34DRAFT_618216 [Clohesyomyces aquaticus]
MRFVTIVRSMIGRPDAVASHEVTPPKPTPQALDGGADTNSSQHEGKKRSWRLGFHLRHNSGHGEESPKAKVKSQSVEPTVDVLSQNQWIDNDVQVNKLQNGCHVISPLADHDASRSYESERRGLCDYNNHKLRRIDIAPDETAEDERLAFFDLVAHLALEGHDYCVNLCLKLVDQARIAKEIPGYDPVYTCKKFSVPISDIRPIEWRRVNRAVEIFKLNSLAERKVLHESDAELIILQLFPQEGRKVLRLACFEILLDTLVQSENLTHARAQRLFDLAPTLEEFLRLPNKTRPHAPLYALPEFEQLQMEFGPRSDEFSVSRYKALVQLVEAAAYKRHDWEGIHYSDPVATLKQYYDAFEQNRQGLPVTEGILPYARDWTFAEQHVLRRGYLVTRLAEAINDFSLFKIIRGSLVGIPGQPINDLFDLQGTLYARAADSGLRISDIPKILILHPERDSDTLVIEKEARIYSGLLADSWRFEEEEQDRLADIERAKVGFRKHKRSEMAWHKKLFKR